VKDATPSKVLADAGYWSEANRQLEDEQKGVHRYEEGLGAVERAWTAT
jgi:hypothetical protein